MADEPLPVLLLTGFLGSGKTTLLNRWLQATELANAAVIVNEFGEIGIDHALIASSNDNTIQLSTGCLCCTVRGDLVDTLRELQVKPICDMLPLQWPIEDQTEGTDIGAVPVHVVMMIAVVSVMMIVRRLIRHLRILLIGLGVKPAQHVFALRFRIINVDDHKVGRQRNAVERRSMQSSARIKRLQS